MRPVTSGVAIGLAVVVVAAGAALLGMRVGQPGQSKVPDRAVVIVTTRSVDGITMPRLIADVSATATGGAAVTLVDPATPATVPGTSARTLADAYSYGGGAAVAALTAGKGVAWLIVPESGIELIAKESGGVPVALPRSVDVYDGQRLYSFVAGAQDVPAESLPALFSGIDYMQAADAKQARAAAEVAVFRAMEESPRVLRQVLAASSTHASIADDTRAAWIERVVPVLGDASLVVP